MGAAHSVLQEDRRHQAITSVDTVQLFSNNVEYCPCAGGVSSANHSMAAQRLTAEISCLAASQEGGRSVRSRAAAAQYKKHLQFGMNSQSPLAFALPLAALPVAQMQQRMAEQAHAATKRLLSAVFWGWRARNQRKIFLRLALQHAQARLASATLRCALVLWRITTARRCHNRLLLQQAQTQRALATLSRFITAWQLTSTSRHRNRAVVQQALARLTNKTLLCAATSWSDYARERGSQRVKACAFMQRLKKKMLCAVFATWRESAQYRAAAKRRVQGAVDKMWRRQLVAVWGAWHDWACYSGQLKTSMQTAARRLACRQLSAAWASWREAVRLSQGKAQRALCHITISTQRHAFMAWRSHHHSSVEQQHKLVKAKTFFRLGSMHRAFAGWRCETTRSFAKRALMQRATDLLQRSRLAKVIPAINSRQTAYQGSRAFRLNVQLTHEYKDKLAKATGKFKHQLVATAYNAWKRFVRHKKMVLTTAVAALRHRCLKACCSAWHEAAIVMQEARIRVAVSKAASNRRKSHAQHLLERATANYKRYCSSRTFAAWQGFLVLCQQKHAKMDKAHKAATTSSLRRTWSTWQSYKQHRQAVESCPGHDMDYTEAFAKAEKQSTLEAAQNSATQAGVHSWHTHMEEGALPPSAQGSWQDYPPASHGQHLVEGINSSNHNVSDDSSTHNRNISIPDSSSISILEEELPGMSPDELYEARLAQQIFDLRQTSQAALPMEGMTDDNDAELMRALEQSLQEYEATGLAADPPQRQGFDVHPAEGRPAGEAGLTNMLNTCYLSAAMQCLAHTDALKDLFLSNSYKADADLGNPVGDQGLVADAFAELMTNMWQGNVESVTPYQVHYLAAKLSSAFSNHMQQDSHELLVLWLSALSEDLDRNNVNLKLQIEKPSRASDADLLEEARSKQKMRCDSSISDIFQSWQRSTLVCLHCGTSSTTLNPSLDLNLSLPLDKLSRASCGVSTSGESLRLQDCLESFQAPQQLVGREMWGCPTCKGLREASKTLQLATAPPVLMVQLKRFSCVDRKPVKLDVPVGCPLTGLDLTELVHQKDAQTPPVYDLYAVVNHCGLTATSGHYTACCMVGEGSDKWKLFDDAVVKPFGAQGVITKDAYILFYKKRTASATDAGGGICAWPFGESYVQADAPLTLQSSRPSAAWRNRKSCCLAAAEACPHGPSAS
ncbi:hypothetical protein ABBQ38_008276 [Trebouxia sp. C0009 RCD-2024]